MKITGIILISASLLVTLFGLVIQDWNKTHVYNPNWPPHARFHAITGIVMNACFSLIGLWLLFSSADGGRDRLLIAALVPIICWGSFFIAASVRGSAVEDVPGEVPRFFEIPLNLLGPAVICAVDVAGYTLVSLSSHD